MAKIVHIGSFSKLWNEEGIARSFEKLGHEVHRLSEYDFDYRHAQDVVESVKPDFILFAKFKGDMYQKENFWTRIAGYKRVAWTFDLYWGLARQELIPYDYIFQMNHYLSPDGGHDEKWKEKKVNHHLLRQGIWDEYCYRGTPQEKFTYDVAFVGTRSNQWKYRDRLTDFLSQRYGERFRWFGMKDEEDIRGEALNDLYASVKVVVGDSVYSPYYWSNRIYETIGRGGFFIHPQVEGLEKEYTPYEHFVPYRYGDFAGLEEKINYFLAHPEKRERISTAGMEHTKKNHTLLNRCAQLLTII